MNPKPSTNNLVNRTLAYFQSGTVSDYKGKTWLLHSLANSHLMCLLLTSSVKADMCCVMKSEQCTWDNHSITSGLFCLTCVGRK